MRTSMLAIAVVLGALSSPFVFAQESSGGFFKKKPAPVTQPTVAPAPVDVPAAPVAAVPSKPPMPPMPPAAAMPTPKAAAAMSTPMPNPFAAGVDVDKRVTEGKPAKAKVAKARETEAAKRAHQADIDGARLRAEAERAARASTPVAATVAPVASVAAIAATPVTKSTGDPAQACKGMSSLVLDVCVNFQCATNTALKSHPTCLKLKDQNAARTVEQISR